jgi:hypothetical protein
MHLRVTADQISVNCVYTGHMNYSTDSDFLPTSPVRRWLQPVLVIAISLLLHLIFFDWLGSRHGATLPRAKDEHVIITALLAPDSPAPVPPPPLPAPAAAAPPRAQIKVARSTVPVEPAEIQPLDDAMPQAPPPQDYASAPLEAVQATPKAVATAALTTAATVADATVPVAPTRRFSPPPSAELKYDVQALRDGKTVFGSGKISWRTSGDTYQIDGEAGVLFFSVLTFKSEGNVDQQGITPLRYSEKRFRKSETNTHFQRDPQRISFSASTAQYPRSGGEQDRASIIWQLAALGRADPTQFGDGLDIFVAGVRDGDIWHVQVLGQEQITVGGEATTAWHLLRTPRAGSFDTQVDIWLAPTRDWYPVKLRQTERNGDYLDMSMSSITALPAQ